MGRYWIYSERRCDQRWRICNAIYRTEETSPAFLEDHSSIDDLIQFRRFENNVQEADWIVEDIEKICMMKN